jgi:hypothetical protein
MNIRITAARYISFGSGVRGAYHCCAAVSTDLHTHPAPTHTLDSIPCVYAVYTKTFSGPRYVHSKNKRDGRRYMRL